MTVQASSCDERVGIKERARCQRRAFIESNENKVGKRKRKMRRSLVDTIMSRIHTSAALSDGPRGDPRRPRPFAHTAPNIPPLPSRSHAARIAVQKRPSRHARTHRDDRGTRSTFRQIASRKRATKNTHLANLLVLLRDVVERHGSKINWRPVSFLSRARKRRGNGDHSLVRSEKGSNKRDSFSWKKHKKKQRGTQM